MPVKVARSAPTVTGPVAISGVDDVLNDASEPLTVPASLLPTIRKWYVVPGLRPESAAEKGLSRRCRSRRPARVWSTRTFVFVPYWNQALEPRLRGLTVPETTAEVAVIELAEPVFTEGAASVTNVRSALLLVPPSLVATSLKW